LRSLSEREAKVPRFDFVGDRDKLEQLYAAKMTFEMDGRFLQFIDQSSATARALASVIRQKQKFPTEAFEKIRDASALSQASESLRNTFRCNKRCSTWSS
jgi:hypothetical protein